MTKEDLILRVDLTRGTTTQEPVSPELRRQYLGGEGMNAWLLWEHFLQIDPSTDPLSPDNVLIVGMGPLGATGLGAGSKTKFTYKSPAYNLYGDTSSGGGLGSQLRWAGCGHIVITGRAKRPVYLWINDGEVEIRDARHLWGKTAQETDGAMREGLGGGGIETATIGPAGENLVRTASIMVASHRAAARGGGGCVFGSKNLKGIAARGTRGVALHHPAAFFQAVDRFLAARNNDAGSTERRMRYGTMQATRGFHGLGFNTFRNGQGLEIPGEKVDRLDHRWYINNIGVRAMACSPGCAFSCGGWYQVKGDESPGAERYAGEWGTKPEYGASNPFGGACDIADLALVGHLNKLCNEYGIDTMELGMAIAFLMELWERGIITPEDTYRWSGEEPLSLEWGNYEAVERLVHYTGTRRNRLGEVLEGGVYQAAVKIGQLKGTDVLKYASYGKAGATHEGPARAWPVLGLSCAVASIGAHHTKGSGISPGASVSIFGRPDAADALGTALKGAAQAVADNLAAISNSLGLCLFLFGKDPDIVPVDLVTEALWAATGLRLTAEELLQAGEKVVNLQKAFNSRLGLRREDDTVCERWMKEPQLEGRSQGMKAENYLETAKDEYYQHHGWDVRTSLQTRAKLEELGMQDVAQVLEREGHLA